MNLSIDSVQRIDENCFGNAGIYCQFQQILLWPKNSTYCIDGMYRQLYIVFRTGSRGLLVLLGEKLENLQN